MTDKYKVDSHKLMYHPERVTQTISAKTWDEAKFVYPIYMEVSPMGACNHRCTFCGVDYIGYVKRQLDADLYEQRVKEMGSLGVKSIMFAGEGEPLLHKQISKMVKDTYFSGIDVSFTTNGVPLTKNFIDHTLQFISWIKVSFNAGSPETYAKIHQCKERDFDKVIENLEYAVEYKKKHNIKCDLGLQSLLLPENVHEMEDLALLCKHIGLDYFVVKPYSQHNFSETHVYENIDYKNYDVKNLESYSDENFNVIVRSETMQNLQEETSYKKCLSTPMLWAYMMATGDIYSCSAYLLDDRFNLGNINTQTFKEIWEGDKRKENFEYVTNELNISECRKNCRMNACNKYLDEIKNKKILNVNFI